MNQNLRVALPQECEGTTFSNMPRFEVIDFGDAWIPLWSYTASESERDFERTIGSMPLATFHIPPNKKAKVVGNLERHVSYPNRNVHNIKRTFRRQFGTSSDTIVPNCTLDELLEHGRDDEWKYSSYRGRPCGIEGAAFTNPPDSKLEVESMLDIKPSKMVDGSLLLQQDQQRLVGDLSGRVDLKNGQFLLAVPFDGKGEVEAYLERNSVPLSAGFFSITPHLSGDIRSTPQYYILSYGRYSKFQHRQDSFEIAYQRTSGPIWISMTDGGAVKDPIYFNPLTATYQFTISLPEAFTLPCTGTNASLPSQSGAEEYITLHKNGEFVNMGRVYSDGAVGSAYQRSQHRAFATVASRIDDFLS